MKIACLQFAPQVGDVDNNLNRADAVLSKASIKDLDLLVLPELAFSGYNFRSLQHISPYLEPSTAGITSLWARTTALKYNCVVTAGYPEKVDVGPKWPTSPEYYNSAITVNSEGETIANYRKSHLYYTDETWALEGQDGFYDGVIPGLGSVAMGICMDINPYKFEAAWNAWEFAHHVLWRESNLVILSMAWRTREDARSFSRTPKEPDMETLSYWLSRLEPLIRNEGEEEIIVVFANRSGTEEEAVYSGTSAVLGIKSGEVRVYGILGRGEKELLMVDTSQRPIYQLISDPKHRSRKPTAKPAEPAEPAEAREPSLPAVSAVSAVEIVDTVPAASEAPTSVPSSAGSSVSSMKSFRSDLSITTGHTSIEPVTAVMQPLDDTKFSPTSPSDDPFIQAYFGDEPVYDVPEPETKSVLSRLPTPIPLPVHDNARRQPPPPISPRFNRPQSPKSRNCSRSRGPALEESPLLGNILSENFGPPTEVRKTLEEVRQSLYSAQDASNSSLHQIEFIIETQRSSTAFVSPTSPLLESILSENTELSTEVRRTLEKVQQDLSDVENSPNSPSYQVDFDTLTPSTPLASAGLIPSPDFREQMVEVIYASEIDVIDDFRYGVEISAEPRPRSVASNGTPQPLHHALVVETSSTEPADPILETENESENENENGNEDDDEHITIGMITPVDQAPAPLDLHTQHRPAHSASAGSASSRDAVDLLLLPPRSNAPFESIFTRNSLGPRSRHIIPRSKSTVW